MPSDVCDWMIEIPERFDGSGPQELAGAEIAIAARITRAASVCERALAQVGLDEADRRAQAVAALRADAGSELDPDVVAALTGVIVATRA